VEHTENDTVKHGFYILWMYIFLDFTNGVTGPA